MTKLVEFINVNERYGLGVILIGSGLIQFILYKPQFELALFVETFENIEFFFKTKWHSNNDYILIKIL